jgi:hypothetical protein
MGLNTENLFVRTKASHDVAAAIEEFVGRAVEDGAQSAAWPLDRSAPRSEGIRRKISVSDPRDGWVAVVESTEVALPSLAVFLSERLKTRVVVVQVYEVTGSWGLAFVDDGTVSGGPTHHDAHDPSQAVRVALAREEISFSPILFRETVGKNANGWQTLVQRGTG